jgi:hypothetical protein
MGARRHEFVSDPEALARGFQIARLYSPALSGNVLPQLDG